MHPGRPGPRGLFAGLATLDVVYRVARAPGPDEKVRALSQELVAGGPAANAAVTYAALGGAATLASALGRHPLTEPVRADLHAHGVVLLDADPERSSQPVVATATVVDATGQRSVVSVGAAQSSVHPGPDLAATVAASAVVLVDGHHPQLALAAARAARATDVPVILDAGSWKPPLDDLLPLVGLAACSAGFRLPGVEDAADVAEAVHERGVRAVVVTSGAGPVTWSSDGSRGVVRVETVRAVDTLGAGDAFHGALAWAVAHRPDASLPELVGFAARVASLRCRFAGQRAWLRAPELAALRDAWTGSPLRGAGAP